MRSTIVILLAAGLVVAGCSGADEAGETSAAVDTAGARGDARAAAPDSESVSGEQSAGGGDVLSVSLPVGQRVIRTAALTLEMADPEAAVRQITALVQRTGGFVASADLFRASDGQPLQGDMTLRVPASGLEDAVSALERLADAVRSKQLGSDDVTDQYTDIEAQLKNLRALETELRALLADIRERSGAADQILAVYERIRQVRGEIEQLEGRKASLDDRIQLATVQVTLQPTPSAAPLSTSPWQPAAVVHRAAGTTLRGLQAVAGALIWIGVTGVPLALIVLGPIVGVFVLARWRRRAAGGASTT